MQPVLLVSIGILLVASGTICVFLLWRIRSEVVNQRRHGRELHTHLSARTTELEAANRELESFCYSVSHDLRTPLRAISGFASILQQEHEHALNDDGRRLVAVIIQGTLTMSKLIDDLLAFSRVGREGVGYRSVDMNELAKSVTSELLTIRTQNAPAGEPAPEIEFGSLPPASGDPALLKQVWVNLLDNAMKYSQQRAAPRIYVSGEVRDHTTIYCVHDNGVGFDMQYYGKLFGVFQRLHRAEEFPGTGVGLAIVHRVVARHGGQVWATSTPGQGATFYFSLPLR